MKNRIYLLTFLTSVALTFHFLQSRTLSENEGEKNTANHYDVEKSNESNLLRKTPEAFKESTKTGWTVLPGNVTVHIGVEENTRTPSFLLNPENLCTSFKENSFNLLVFVASKLRNFARRQAIRDTWALKALQEALSFRVVFALGQSNDETTQKLAMKESFRYGDILQIDIQETFQNLAKKSFACLFWSAKFCNSADFVMKADDDILIHIPNLLEAIKTAKEPENLLLCHENHRRKILRKELLASAPETYGKYEVDLKDLPGTYYPPYCSGMAYVFSSFVRDNLLQASLVTPLFFIEDVYVTGFCRYKAGIKITFHQGITLRPPLTAAQAVCSFKEGRITSQEVGVDELRQLWAETNTQGFFCPKLLGYARPQAADV